MSGITADPCLNNSQPLADPPSYIDATNLSNLDQPQYASHMDTDLNQAQYTSHIEATHDGYNSDPDKKIDSNSETLDRAKVLQSYNHSGYNQSHNITNIPYSENCAENSSYLNVSNGEKSEDKLHNSTDKLHNSVWSNNQYQTPGNTLAFNTRANTSFSGQNSSMTHTFPQVSGAPYPETNKNKKSKKSKKRRKQKKADEEESTWEQILDCFIECFVSCTEKDDDE